VFRLMNVYLRNGASQDSINAFVADSANNKSILTLSAISARKGPSRTKRTPGSEVYPFVTMLRRLLTERAGQLCGGQMFDLVGSNRAGPRTNADVQNKIDSAEKLLVLLDILENRAKETDFDYSATQLLASWLGEGLAALPELAEAATTLQGLSSSVEIVTGRGQSEIWSLFRADRQEFLEDLRVAIGRVRDPSTCSPECNPKATDP
jgi:midasin